MKPLTRNILFIILAVILAWIFWRLFKGAIMVLLLIAVIVVLVYAIIKIK